MKKLLAILSMSLFIFAMVSGIVYLKEEEPEVYRQIVERLDKDTQIADNNEIIKESDATSGDNEDESIDVSTEESIPSDELQSVQKTGRVPTGVADGGAHAWNIIKLGENFYNVDVLWDDTVGESYNTKCYVYFNLPDSEFSKDHTRTGLSINLPNCTETDMTYESLYGGSTWGDMLSTYGLTQDDVISTLEEYYEVCIEKLTEAGTGQSTFTIALKDKELFDEIYNDAKQEENLNGYMNTVAQNLGLTNYRLSLEFSVTQLPDESIILTQNSNIISK